MNNSSRIGVLERVAKIRPVLRRSGIQKRSALPIAARIIVRIGVAGIRILGAGQQRHFKRFRLRIYENMFHHGGEIDRVVASRVSLLPRYVGLEILLAINLVAKFAKATQFMVVDGDEYRPIVSQKISCKVEARKHHIQPVRMISSNSVRVRAKSAPRIVNLAGPGKVGIQAFGKFVRVNELLPGVVGRVDIDHFDFAEIRLLQQFQDFEIFAFDKDVAGRFEIHRLGPVRVQSRAARLLDDFHAVRLARPDEPEALAARLDPIAERPPQRFEVNVSVGQALGETLREEIFQHIALSRRRVVRRRDTRFHSAFKRCHAQLRAFW